MGKHSEGQREGLQTHCLPSPCLVGPTGMPSKCHPPPQLWSLEVSHPRPCFCCSCQPACPLPGGGPVQVPALLLSATINRAQRWAGQTQAPPPLLLPARLLPGGGPAKAPTLLPLLLTWLLPLLWAASPTAPAGPWQGAEVGSRSVAGGREGKGGAMAATGGPLDPKSPP